MLHAQYSHVERELWKGQFSPKSKKIIFPLSLWLYKKIVPSWDCSQQGQYFWKESLQWIFFFKCTVLVLWALQTEPASSIIFKQKPRGTVCQHCPFNSTHWFILKDTYVIHRLLLLFWVMTRNDLHASVLKKHMWFLILSSAAALYSPSVWNALF